MAGKAGRRSFGALRKLPSGNWQASYVGPDALRHVAPSTFTAKFDAEAWIVGERRLVEGGSWVAPAKRKAALVPVPFAKYAGTWLDHRTLKPRTRVLYRGLLDRHVLPTFGTLGLREITRADVRAWHADLEVGEATKAHAYGLLRTILNTAVEDELIERNPCSLRGAGTSPPAREIRPASPAEIETIVEGMPQQWQALILVLAWCGLRGGEALELRRRDVEIDEGTGRTVIRVRRAVSRLRGEWLVGTPKSRAGMRDVVVPPHIVEAIHRHLAEFTGDDPEALLWPSVLDPERHLQRSTLTLAFKPAAAAAGRSDLRLHDLRHTAAVLGAIAGGTTAELMGRLGHSTPAAAQRYQHVAAGRDALLADAMSKLAR